MGMKLLQTGLFYGSLLAWTGAVLALLVLVPATTVLGRLAGRGRTSREPAAPSGDGEEGDGAARLRAALARAETAKETAQALFAEAGRLPGADVLALALVDEAGTRAAGYAARGADEEWWRGVSVDLEHDAGELATAVREQAAFAVYDVAAAPTLGARLAEAAGARSVAFVPLVAEGHAVGVLAVASREPRFFSTAELEAAQRLADETAPVLARLRSAKALRRALEREKLVAEIARKVRSELDLDDVLEVAVAETGRALGVARCFIRLGREGDPMPVRAEWRRPKLAPIGQAERLPVSNLALRLGRTVAVGDVEHAPELDDPTLGGREVLLDLGTRAALSTPIVVFDQTIGVFTLHREEPRAWSASDVGVAEAVAGEVGIAIHAARLLEEDERRLGLQSALLKAAQVVTSDLRFESVLRRLVDEVAVLFGADAADCWMFEPGTSVLRCRAVYGLPEDEELGRTIPPAGWQARAIETGAPVLARDFAVTEDPPPSKNFAGFAEIMIAPMTWLGEVRGVLGVCSRESGRFQSSELEILEAFARFASLASHNAESFEERERQARIQQGFYRIAEVLGSPLSLAETLEALAEAASEALGGEASAVLVTSDGRLRLAGSSRLPAPLGERLAGGLPAELTPFPATAAEGRIVSSGSLAGDDRFGEDFRALLAEHGFAALLSAPVQRLGGESAVVVVLFSSEQAFTDDDLVLARQLSGAARGALERSEHFESERRARSLSERLASVGARLVTSLTPEDVLREVAGEAAELLDASAAAVRLLEGEELVVRATAGPAGAGLEGSRVSSGHGLLGDVAQSRSAVAVDDVSTSPQLGRGDPLLGEARACIAVPMSGPGGRLRGVLSVYAPEPRSWRPDEVQALVALAAMGSSSLANSVLYRDVAEEKERSEAILGNIADGIVATDREGTIVLWNSMAERITGVPASEAIGRRIAETLQRELASGEEEPKGERAVSIVRGGKDVWLSLTEAVMRDSDGVVAGRIFAFRDVSSERAVEQMKSDFVATVSHELRTPLTSIYGFAETLLRADVAFDEHERAVFLGYIASESERLIRIVDDLLNVARLEAGMLNLTLAATDVAEVVASTVARARAESPEAPPFAVELPEAELHVEADPARLAEVLGHLVENAIRSSPDGGTVTVSARRKSDAVEVRVTDEGSGFGPTERQRIFTKFFRPEGPAGAQEHGTGLGLFLARGLVAAMGGRMWVESERGAGATFVFELPVSKPGPAGKA